MATEDTVRYKNNNIDSQTIVYVYKFACCS